MVTGPGPVLRAAGRVRLRRGAPRRRRASAGCRSQVARHAAGQGAPGRDAALHGRHRRPARGAGLAPIAALTAAMPALTNPRARARSVRVNLIAAGFVDTPLSAALLGDQLDARREQLRDDAADRPGRRPRRHRRARRPPHDEHGPDRRDLRHRRRPAARLTQTPTTATGARPRPRQVPPDGPARDRRRGHGHDRRRGARRDPRGLPGVLRRRPLRRVDALRPQVPRRTARACRVAPADRDAGHHHQRPPRSRRSSRQRRIFDARLPASRVVVIDAGHFFWEEAPAEYAAIVRDSITGATTPEGSIR